jgi:hypothetical protein
MNIATSIFIGKMGKGTSICNTLTACLPDGIIAWSGYVH